MQWRSSPVPGAVVVDGVAGIAGAVVVTGAGTVGVTGAAVVTGTGTAVATGAVGVVITAAAGAARVVEAKANKEASNTAVQRLWDFMILLANVSGCRGFRCLRLQAEGAYVNV